MIICSPKNTSNESLVQYGAIIYVINMYTKNACLNNELSLIIFYMFINNEATDILKPYLITC